MAFDPVLLARFLLTGIALLLALLAAATWSRRKDAPAAAIFALLIGLMAVYAFGYAGEVAQTTIAGAQFWLDIEYLALPWAAGLWLLAACRHNGIKVSPELLLLIPMLTFVAHYTNFHHLFYSGPMQLMHRGPFWILVVQRGPLSLLDTAYLFVAFLAGAWIYIVGYRNASHLYRKQSLVLVFCSLLPFVGYSLYRAGLTPWGLDIAPVTLGFTCILIYYGIFNVGIFDLAPLGRNLIFDSIRDAVLILDTRERLLDFNSAAQTLLPVLSKGSLGQEVLKTLVNQPATLLRALVPSEEAAEIPMGEAPGSLFYEVRSWPISAGRNNAKGRQLGRAVIFSDVSAQVRLREELRRQSETDALTGIANRRRFHQAFEAECSRFGRGHAPFSVLMIDLDHFKNVNDRFGHLAGDAVLRGVAATLVGVLRKTDLPARYGGEEFAVLLLETRQEGAMVIAEKIRAAVRIGVFEMDNALIPVTISVGVASHASDCDIDPLILLKKADLALYRAKAAGRDRVETVS